MNSQEEPQPRPDISPVPPGPQPVGETTHPEPQRVAVRLPLHSPIVTWVLLAIIVVVFLIETLLGGSTDIGVLLQMGAKYTPLIAAGEYWRLFTSMFLHIGVMHLAFNGYALFVVGTELERLVGPGRFLAIYLLSGLFGSLASYALSAHLAAGASGAVFGIVGALAAFFLVHREKFGAWGIRRLAQIGFVILLNLVWGFRPGSGIDNYAHVGGLVAGLALGWALAPRYELVPRYEGGSVRMQLVDRNNLRRYWPALGLAVLLLLGSTALVTRYQRTSLGSYLYRSQQAIEREAWDEAAAELEQAIALDPAPTDPDVYFHLGLARTYLEQPEEAIPAYEAALEIDPAHTAALWNLAMTYRDLKRYAQARTAFEAFRELTPAGPVEVKPYLDELERLGY